MPEPVYAEPRVALYQADCVEVMRQMPEASVDAVVTDPPYGLEFMGKEWDKLNTRNYAGISEGNDSPHARRYSINFVGSKIPHAGSAAGSAA